jgi:hypothetical protein
VRDAVHIRPCLRPSLGGLELCLGWCPYRAARHGYVGPCDVGLFCQVYDLCTSAGAGVLGHTHQGMTVFASAWFPFSETLRFGIKHASDNGAFADAPRGPGSQPLARQISFS